jgi:hypothetical protein
MNDSDPRPMPPQVSRAYHSPIDYASVLRSFRRSMYMGRKRDVLQSAVQILEKKHGKVWVWRDEQEVLLSDLIRDGIDTEAIQLLLYEITEYGYDDISSAIAASMQPLWAERWESMSGSNMGRIFFDASRFIGDRQFVWIAAQCARSVIDYPLQGIRRVALRAIEAAEQWCVSPTRLNADNAGITNLPGVVQDDTPYSYRSLAAFSAFMAARSAWQPASKLDDAWNSIGLAAESEAGRSDIDFETDAMDRMAEIAKEVFTPTLIVRPSGGAFATSRSTRRRIVATAAGAAIGAAASFALGRRGIR